jgi:polyisoprenoid-binding protein YceI
MHSVLRRGEHRSAARRRRRARARWRHVTIEAHSLDTKQEMRDKHLRSANFFDVANHPQVRFVSDSATANGDTLKIAGHLYAAGKGIPLAVDARLRDVGIDGELEIEATALVDHRQLGMTWSPLGIMRAPRKLIVRGRLVRQDDQR